MTPQEVYNELQARYVFIAEGIFDSYEVTDALFDALEKQMPKKVVTVKRYEDFDEETKTPYFSQFYICGLCGEHIGTRCNKYCGNCGQALDWREEE